jgi:hypothetical protein
MLLHAACALYRRVLNYQQRKRKLFSSVRKNKNSRSILCGHALNFVVTARCNLHLVSTEQVTAQQIHF